MIIKIVDLKALKLTGVTMERVQSEKGSLNKQHVTYNNNKNKEIFRKNGKN